jgi:hypothetical protein
MQKALLARTPTSSTTLWSRYKRGLPPPQVAQKLPARGGGKRPKRRPRTNSRGFRRIESGTCLRRCSRTSRASAGTQFTCFTSAEVQILTPAELQAPHQRALRAHRQSRRRAPPASWQVSEEKQKENIKEKKRKKIVKILCPR